MLVVDALSFHAAVTASNVKVPAEQSLVVHLRWLRSLLDAGVLSRMVWCDTRDMLADGMTKGAVDRVALHDAMDGLWRISHELKTWTSPLTTRPGAASSSTSSTHLVL